MVHALLQHSYVGVDGFGRIVLERFSLWERQNLKKRETTLYSEVEALRWAIESILQHSSCQRFGTDCKDLIAMIKEP